MNKIEKTTQKKTIKIKRPSINAMYKLITLFLLLFCCGLTSVESKSVVTRKRRANHDLDLTYKSCVTNEFCHGNGDCYVSTDVNKLQICR